MKDQILQAFPHYHWQFRSEGAVEVAVATVSIFEIEIIAMPNGFYGTISTPIRPHSRVFFHRTPNQIGVSLDDVLLSLTDWWAEMARAIAEGSSN